MDNLIESTRIELSNKEAELIEATREAADAAEMVKTLRETWERQNAEVLDRNLLAKTRLAEAEMALKEAAIRLYSLTRDKSVGELVSIKEKAGALVYDSKKAIEWCRDNMKAAITEVLDTKVFESYSKVDELDFVERQDTIPTAQVARKKLDEYTT